MRTEIPFSILSACRPEYSGEANEHRTAALALQLRARDLDFAPVSGYWRGAAESAFLVLCPERPAVWPSDDGRALALVRLLADRYGQDAILYVDANRAARLLLRGPGRALYADEQALGQWREVQSTDGLEGYTRTADGRTWAAS